MEKKFKIFAMKITPGHGEENYSFKISANDTKESFRKAKEVLADKYLVNSSLYEINSTEY